MLPSQQSLSSRAGKLLDVRHTTIVLVPTSVLSLVLVATHLGFTQAATTGLLWSIACLVAGAGFGFLFGIPRVIQDEKEKATQGIDGLTDSAALINYRQRVNTNLTEISDWLTKILVGLGLVNLQKIPDQISRLVDILASGLQPADPANQKGFALALIVCFLILGFLYGYLYTRLFLAGAFARADQGINIQVERIVESAAQTLSENVELSLTTTQATPSQFLAAAQVEQLVSSKEVVAVRQQLLELAREYEAIRATISPGHERTRKMEIVVAKMRTLALAGYPLLDEFAGSQSAGERLVAITMLQVKPNIKYLQWLSTRLGEEKPFVGYQSGLALLYAVRTLASSHREELLGAVQEAKLALGESMRGTDRDQVLSDAENELRAE